MDNIINARDLAIKYNSDISSFGKVLFLFANEFHIKYDHIYGYKESDLDIELTKFDIANYVSNNFACSNFDESTILYVDFSYINDPVGYFCDYVITIYDISTNLFLRDFEKYFKLQIFR